MRLSADSDLIKDILRETHLVGRTGYATVIEEIELPEGYRWVMVNSQEVHIYSIRDYQAIATANVSIIFIPYKGREITFSEVEWLHEVSV